MGILGHLTIRLNSENPYGYLLFATHLTTSNPGLKITENMPIGPNMISIPREQGSYANRLIKVFNNIQHPALIILNILDMEPKSGEIRQAKNSRVFQEMIGPRSLMLKQHPEVYTCTKGRHSLMCGENN